MLGCVSCSMFPWNPEAHGLPVNPHQTRVSPAVHLGDQPGLQPDASRGDRHPAWSTNTQPAQKGTESFPLITTDTNDAADEILQIRIFQTLFNKTSKSSQAVFLTLQYCCSVQVRTCVIGHRLLQVKIWAKNGSKTWINKTGKHETEKRYTYLWRTRKLVSSFLVGPLTSSCGSNRLFPRQKILLSH